MQTLTEAQKAEYIAANKAGIDTTGQLIIRSTDSGYYIARDTGWYEGTIPEYNVRCLEHIADLPHLSWCDEIIGRVMMNDRKYGQGWGSGSALFKITEAEQAELIAADAAKAAAQAEKERQEIEAWQTMASKSKAPGWCNRCQSYCFGDCTA